MKKEVENKNSFITDLSSSESSGDETDKEIPIENKQEINKEIEKYLLIDDEKIIKKNSPKKTKKLVKKRETSSGSSVDQDQEKSIKKPKKSTHKESPKKSLIKGDDFKKLQKKAKKLGATSLDYSKRKNNKYMVEYNGKKIHFGFVNTEDYIIHKDTDRRNKYLTKSQNKNGELFLPVS